MTLPHRRGLAALILAGALAAGSAHAADKLAPLAKAFPFLQNFLQLPAAERNRFSVAYVFRQDGRPLTAPMWIVEGGARTPLPVKGDGRVERLPNLAQLEHAQLEVGIPATSKLSLSFDIRPATPPAAQMDARELAASVVQAAAATRKAAGVFALAAPKLQKVVFLGAAAGEAELADGHKVALPIEAGHPVFRPAALPTARSLHFAAAPSAMAID